MNEFDASKIYTADTIDRVFRVSADNRFEKVKRDLAAISMFQLALQAELRYLEFVCNKRAWDHWTRDLPAPTPEQADELLKRLDSRSFEKDARQAAAHRYLIARVDDLAEDVEEEVKAAQEAASETEEEKREREAFEAHEATQRERRFADWRKTRHG